jgi:hypothetical protein
MRYSIQPTRKPGAAILWIAILSFCALQMASADHLIQHESWPVEMSEYAAWALQWSRVNADNSGAPNWHETDGVDAYSQWALQWDLDNLDLIDAHKTIQWLGVPSDEWIMNLRSAKSDLTIIRSPSCYRAIGGCDAA